MWTGANWTSREANGGQEEPRFCPSEWTQEDKSPQRTSQRADFPGRFSSGKSVSSGFVFSGTDPETEQSAAEEEQRKKSGTKTFPTNEKRENPLRGLTFCCILAWAQPA